MPPRPISGRLVSVVIHPGGVGSRTDGEARERVSRDAREGFSELSWSFVLPSLHSREGLELIGKMGWKRTEWS